MTRRCRRDRGAAFLPVLGLCLIMLFVGGISLDTWRGLSERRALQSTADGASIAGGNGIDEQHFRDTGELRLDPERAEDLAWDNLARQSDTRSLTRAEVTATTENVTVTLTGRVEFTLLGVFLDDQEPFTVTATAVAGPQGGGP